MVARIPASNPKKPESEAMRRSRCMVVANLGLNTLNWIPMAGLISATVRFSEEVSDSRARSERTTAERAGSKAYGRVEGRQERKRAKRKKAASQVRDAASKERTMCFCYRMRRAIICHDVPFQKSRPRTCTVAPLATVTRLSVEAFLVTWTTV